MSGIITGMLCKISDGDRVRAYLLTDSAYHDPALSTPIEYGTALPVIPRQAGLSISEQISFQPQGGSNNVSASNVPLINTEGFFDDWGGWVLSGLQQVIKRGYADQPWSEWVTIFDGVGKGKPEFVGRSRVNISLNDAFSYMRQPVASQVFSEDDVSNTSLINTTVPMVFGSAYQVDPLVTEPQILRYAVGSNVNDVPRVQEGGNPSTPVFAYVPLGFQLFASPTLEITCDVSGPAVEGWEEGDVLASIGSFGDWTSGHPDGWDVIEDAPYAVINEESGTGHARVENTAKIDGDTGWITGTDWVAQENTSTELSYDGTASGGLEESLEADDGDYASVEHRYSEAYSMTGKGWEFGLSEDVEPVELDVRVVCETSGGNQDIDIRYLYLRFPDGTTRNLLTPAANWVPTTKDTLEFSVDNNVYGGYRVTREILEAPDLELLIQTWQPNGAPQTVKIHEIAIRVHYGTIVDRLRLTSEADVMTVGNRYLLKIHTEGGSGDSIQGFWGGVSSHAADLPESDNPNAQISAQLEASDVHEFSFIAPAAKFAIEFDRGDGNGEQTIKKIELLDKTASRERYAELMKYIHETADRDPDEVCDVDSFDIVQERAGNPRLGWYVSDQTTRDQLAVLFSHSLGATCWGGIDGLYHATQMRVPQQPDGDYLEIIGAFDVGHARADKGDDLRDRVNAARNVKPLRESETAGVTTTWTQDQRQLVLVDWRITEKADWSNLVGFPTFTLSGIDPSTGDTEGGTTVTLTGTGLSAFDSGAGDTIMFGDNAATNITVVSDTEITCATPAGTEGSVDVTVTVGSESRSLAFEYVSSGGGGGWTPADLADLLIWHHTRDPANYTLDGGHGTQWDDLSGNDYHATQGQVGYRPPLVQSAIGGFPAFDFQDHYFDSPLADTHGEYAIFVMLDPDNETAFREFVFTSDTPMFFVAHIGGSNNVASYDGSWQNYGAPQTGVQSLLWRLVEGPGAAEAFRNGASIGTATWSSREIGAPSAIGSRPSQNQELNGRIGEIVIARAPLSQDSIDKIAGYAHHAWDRADLLPASHPYKSSPP